MRAVPITQHGGPEVLQLLEDARSDAWSRAGPGARPRVRAESPGPLAAARARAREAAAAAHSRQRHLGRGGRPRRERVGRRRPRHRPSGAQLRSLPSLSRRAATISAPPTASSATRARAAMRSSRPCPRETSSRYRASVSFTDGAAFPLTFLTAWHMLVSRAHVREGETVLVMAAGSGVGQAAIQVAPPARRARDRDRRQQGEAGAGAGAGR